MSKSINFITYLLDPFGTQNPLIYLMRDDGTGEVTSLEQLGGETFVTYDPWKLVDAFRHAEVSLPRSMVSLNDALKLHSGLARDQGGERHWDVWRSIKAYIPEESDYETLTEVVENRVPRPQQEEAIRLLAVMATALSKLWGKISEDLDEDGEYERFVRIEVPVQQIFYHRQLAGLRINNEKLLVVIEGIKKDKYQAFQGLAKILKFSPSELNFRNVTEFLSGTDASHLVEFAGAKNFLDYFKIAQESSSFAKLFVTFSRANRDLATLVRMATTVGRVRPIFQCFGTVTSRILVSDPRLQEIRKQYREVIVADEGKILAYLDYAQFEPGILASICKDQNFIRQYNTSDLYLALSNALFGTSDHRDTCKRIFLGFCYGMKKESMVKLLAGKDASEEKLQNIAKLIASFFDAFPGLLEYRKTIEKKLLLQGYISTFWGNKRVRTDTGPLSTKEERWAMSQSIQGSASLIFKEGLIAIKERFGSDSILLPMHDAVLLQFEDDEDYPEKINEAKKIMIGVMKDRCPAIEPKVVEERFAPV